MARKGYGRNKISIPSKYIFLILSILCVGMMLISFTTDFVTGPVETVAGYIIVPFQKGIASAGGWLTGRSENIRKINELNEENRELKEKVDELTIQIINFSK